MNVSRDTCEVPYLLSATNFTSAPRGFFAKLRTGRRTVGGLILLTGISSASKDASIPVLGPLSREIRRSK